MLHSHADTKQHLQLLLDSGRLASRYEEDTLNSILTNTDPNSYYNKTAAKKGREAAEAAIRKWHNERCLPDFAASILPVARGMMAMLKADPDSVKLTDATHREFSYYHPHEGKMLVLVNRRRAPGYRQPQDVHTFGLDGLLGIKAILLAEDNDKIKLGLVLPIRLQHTFVARNEMNVAHYNLMCRNDGFTVVMIGTDGEAKPTEFMPKKPDPAYMWKLLGLEDGKLPGHWVTMSRGIDDFDEIVGFPGAREYLARNAPLKLEAYFEELAGLVGNSLR